MNTPGQWSRRRYLPRPIARFAVVMLFVAVGHHPVMGTTVLPAFVECPVCGESFVIWRLGSYSSFGEPARDLSDSSFARFGKVRVCPHCLYATLDSEFATLPADKKKALRTLLENPRLQLHPEEVQALQEAGDNPWIPSIIAKAGLARQCYDIRGEAESRELDLRMLLFYRTTHTDYRELHKFYRRQVIERLRQEISAGCESPRKQAVNTYLLGELLRQHENPEAALDAFARAAELAKVYNKPHKKDDRYSLLWIVYWSAEQSLRIRLATKTAEQLRPLLSREPPPDESPEIDHRKIAVETLGQRDDLASWQVLTDFARKDPRNLEFLLDRTCASKEKLRVDPRLWAHLQQQYAKASEPGRQKSEPFGPRQRLAGKLRQALYEEDWGDHGSARDATSLMEALPQTPRDWPEARVVASLHRCIQAGHRPAVDYFFRWCRTLDEGSLDDNLIRIVACLKTLAAQPKLWSLPADLAASDIPEQRLLATCLQYVRGDEAARKSLLNCIARDRTCRGLLAIDSLKLRQDPAAIDVLLARPKEDNVDDFLFTAWANSYLEHVATPAHLDAIKQRVARQSIFDREDTETISRTIQFRELLRRSLPANPTRNGAAGLPHSVGDPDEP